MISIGILGTPINNKNLGCQALTYSLINMLEKVGYGLDLMLASGKNGQWSFHQFLLTIGVDQHAKQRRNFENKQ